MNNENITNKDIYAALVAILDEIMDAEERRQKNPNDPHFRYYPNTAINAIKRMKGVLKLD